MVTRVYDLGRVQVKLVVDSVAVLDLILESVEA